jgi:hypothetical protein
MIYRFQDKNSNHYATNEPTIYRFRDKHANPPPMNPRSNAFETSTLTITPPFIGGVMVNVLILKAVDRGFIDGVMVSVLVSKAVDHGFTLSKTSTLTITPLMNP